MRVNRKFPLLAQKAPKKWGTRHVFRSTVVQLSTVVRSLTPALPEFRMTCVRVRTWPACSATTQMQKPQKKELAFSIVL
jgi:hypothetical protein